MARGRKHLENIKQWRQRVAAWARSELSQSAYCRRNGIVLPTFNYWKRRLEKERPRGRARFSNFAPPPPPFLPVRIVTPNGTTTESNSRQAQSVFAAKRDESSAITVQLRNGRILRCADSIAPEALGQLATALEGAIPC